LPADEDAAIGRRAPEGALGASRANPGKVGEAGLAGASSVSVSAGISDTGSADHTGTVAEV